MSTLNLEATAAALLTATSEMKVVKRNASGSVNGNAMSAIIRRAAVKLQDAGWSRKEAYPMVWELEKKFAK